jgi:alpha-mannosidase
MNSTIDNGGVQYILDSVIACLLEDPARMFIYVEQAFFQRWWQEQSDSMKSDVRGLVANGQLEFINGGYCMHDEATTHFIDMIDQTALGHQFIANEFGVYPKVGWQIDPFGHSATQASLLSYEVGFESIFFKRIDMQDLAVRQEAKTTELIWQASASAGPENGIFTGIMYW